MVKEFDPQQFAIDAGWDWSCVEATAAKGVSDVDCETIRQMSIQDGFDPDEAIEELRASCVARCAERVSAAKECIRHGSFGPIVWDNATGETRMATQEDMDTLPVGRDLTADEEAGIEE